MTIPWTVVIKFILWLISIGMPRKTAINMAAAKFKVSRGQILKHSGF